MKLLMPQTEAGETSLGNMLARRKATAKYVSKPAMADYNQHSMHSQDQRVFAGLGPNTIIKSTIISAAS
jgi:hypothetical protein